MHLIEDACCFTMDLPIHLKFNFHFPDSSRDSGNPEANKRSVDEERDIQWNGRAIKSIILLGEKKN